MRKDTTDEMCVYVRLVRQEVSALRSDFVRRRAEEEAYYAQQVEKLKILLKHRFCCNVYVWLAHIVNLYMKHKPGMEIK